MKIISLSLSLDEQDTGRSHDVLLGGGRSQTFTFLHQLRIAKSPAPLPDTT